MNQSFGGGAFRIGQIFGIDVKIHYLFVLLLLYFVLFQGNAAVFLLLEGVLFGSVLLHELGHCAGARAVGGRATEIVLWPLGGFTLMSYPRSWFNELVATAAGPAVNLLLCLVALVVWLFAGGPQQGLTTILTPDEATTPVAHLAGLTLVVNAVLFLFNVLPAYPMDGGRIFRAVMTPLFGWRSATLVATGTAMLFGAGFALLGLAFDPVLILIAIMILLASHREFTLARDYRPLPRVEPDGMPRP